MEVVSKSRTFGKNDDKEKKEPQDRKKDSMRTKLPSGHNRDHRRAAVAATLGWMMLAEASRTGLQRAGGMSMSKERWIPLVFIPFPQQGSVRWAIRVISDHSDHL